MSTEENKALLRRVHEAFNKAGTATMDQYFAPDFVEHELPPGMPQTLEGTKMFLGTLFAAFPDRHFQADDMVAEGDKVVAHVWVSGTHKGEFQGMPPTGKQIKVEAFDMVRVAGGKLVEHWGVFDALGLMQQLGAIPAPGQPPK